MKIYMQFKFSEELSRHWLMEVKRSRMDKKRKCSEISIDLSEDDNMVLTSGNVSVL